MKIRDHILFSLIVAFCTCILHGQMAYELRTEVKNAAFSERLYPCYYPVIRDSSSSGEILMNNLGGAKYEIKYTPNLNFIGRDTIVIEYKNRVGAGAKISRIAYILNYVHSVVVARHDFLSCNKNAQNISFEPLLNDSTSYGNPTLNLKNVNGFNHLTATISGNSINYTPTQDFVGIAYLNYEVCDSIGTCSDGKVQIQVIDPATQKESDTLNISTAEDTELSISLDLADFTIVDSASKGSMEAFDYGLHYRPFKNVNGKDSIYLTSNNFSRKIYITIIATPENNSIIAGDKFVTPRNKEIIFDVSKNDVYPVVYDNNLLIDQYPSKGTLTALNMDGLMKYIPESNYEGVQTFTYRTCPQGICETATVTLLIGDYKPNTTIDYQFSTYKNTPVLLAYNIPIDAYQFTSTDTFLKFYPGWDTINSFCNSSFIGYNQLIYFPPYNFADTVDFTIEYCVTGSGGSCKSVDCSMIVINEQRNCNKHCIGDDCVWPGDVDLNGHVNMHDLLHVGYALGATGHSRTYGASSYRALIAENWTQSLKGNAHNMKHADTDGNGVVNQSDVDVISNFYHKEHSLVPSPVYERGDFPFEFELLNPNVDSGETAFIALVLGDDNYPVINQSSFAYELDYNKDVVYEPSLQVEFLDQSWFARGATTLDLYKKPWDGRLESGFVRANGNFVSGKGRVEVLSFIVEDNVDPWRRDDESVKIPFYFKNIVSLSGEGKMVQLEDKTVYLNLRKNKTTDILDASKLVIYPNPASHLVNLHLNGSNELKSYTILDLSGRELFTKTNLSGQRQVIDLTTLQNGLYIVKVETKLGPIIKKIEVLK